MNDALREWLNAEPRHRTVRQYRPEFGVTRIYEVIDYVGPYDTVMCAVKDTHGAWHPYDEGGYFPAVTRVDSPTSKELADAAVFPYWND